ncbi:hypothetical protein CWC50_02090 [Enterococcus faecium]|nr:hypothetical protein CWC50_02090 [Enterococcus faecium]
MITCYISNRRTHSLFLLNIVLSTFILLQSFPHSKRKAQNGFESIPRTRFVRIFSRFQRVSISSFRPAVKPKPFDR